MKNYAKIIIVGTLFIFFQRIIFAHQPRLVEKNALVVIQNPEVSQAFYGQLEGEPVNFVIDSADTFTLYVGILSPVQDKAKKDFIVDVVKNDEIITSLNGNNYEWKEYHEEFAGDYYNQGPDYETSADPGKYQITISNSDNQGKYVLVVGKKEEFPLNEIANAVKILPKLKADFFNKSPLTAFLNRIGLFIFFPLIVLFIMLIIIMKLRRKKK